ncbi:aspartokinase 2 [Pullulanibacillus camelliae]|uniref:Aspartokinase n=1 Tax=Pullulanibacillus camelliae TaxID=1707096 RepID=A0A8J2VXK4_9BACL|nr:aspartate kinase [Pullulanibacillus camelliae]GGE42377.1 aspartokinase 2 [Pullulanibacillus camelliae]
MSITVMKFGGTSVGSIARIKSVADRIISKLGEGEQVVVVVSAMGKTTDHLLELAKQISERPKKRELDMLLSTGEQQTIALLAMEMEARGYPAISLTGWQAGIRTERVYGNARIEDIKTEILLQHLSDDRVVVVAGFQGVAQDQEITTLGRGGSDTSAVALAAALKASLCEIYTDVDGVYTTDPRVVKEARKLKEISYDEMLEMAYLGAGVLHPRAVENAKKYHVPLTVRSSFDTTNGTIIKGEAHLEKGLAVRGLAFEREVVKVTLLGLPNEIHTLPTVFQVLAESNVNVDVIIQNALDEQETSISFTLAEAGLADALEVIKHNKPRLKFQEINVEADLAKVSIVGSGMVSNPGVAATMFKTLSDEGIKVKMVSTSEIKVSTVIAADQLNKALNACHRAFRLEEAPETSSAGVE